MDKANGTNMRAGGGGGVAAGAVTVRRSRGEIEVRRMGK